MKSNRLTRIGLLMKIEWKKKWKIILVPILTYMFIIIVSTVMGPANNLTIADQFLFTHFIMGTVLILGVQIYDLFPELRNQYKTLHLIQLPATASEKYLTKLVFPFIITPSIFLIAFLITRPICLQACFWLKGFIIYPLYASDLRPMFVSPFVLSLLVGSFFIPGAFIFKRANLVVSSTLFLVLFVLAAWLSSVFFLPAFQSYGGNGLGRALEAQSMSFVYFFTSNLPLAAVVCLLGMVPFLLYAGYSLFKQHEL